MTGTFLRSSLLLLLLAGLTGCGIYGGLVNTLAPERDRWSVLEEASRAPEIPASAVSAFCPGPSREVYMVMPELGGQEGKLHVTFNDGSELLLEGDYSGAQLLGEEKKSFTGDQEMLEKTFGPAVAALPDAPFVATLYFVFGKTDLQRESRPNVEFVHRQIMARPEAEIHIVGHTDTVGSAARNQELSVSRAERVRRELIDLGVPAERIVSVSGRGEESPRVRTADNVNEPKNRRVEVTVR